MPHYRSLEDVLKAGDRRRHEQQQLEAEHLEHIRRIKRRQAVCQMLLSGIGLSLCCVAFASPWWCYVLTWAPGALAHWALWRWSFGILLGFVCGSLSALPMIALIFITGHTVSGSGMNMAAGAGQLIVLFFCGIGAPVIAGGLAGFLRDRVDDDQVLI